MATDTPAFKKQKTDGVDCAATTSTTAGCEEMVHTETKIEAAGCAATTSSSTTAACEAKASPPVPATTGSLRADTKGDNASTTNTMAGGYVKQPLAAEKPNILVIGGPSGVGKGTVLKLLLDRHPELFSFSVSNTTRGPRPGEEDGVHYNFVTQDEFKAAIDQKEMLEYAHVHTNYYGTSAKAVEKVIHAGKCCVLDIDVQGAEQVHEHYVQDADVKMSFVFFKPPDMDELEKRLRGRGTETEEKIQKRLKNAHTEVDTAENKHTFWEFVTNEVVEDSYRKLCARVGVKAKEMPKNE